MYAVIKSLDWNTINSLDRTDWYRDENDVLIHNRFITFLGKSFYFADGKFLVQNIETENSSGYLIEDLREE